MKARLFSSGLLVSALICSVNADQKVDVVATQGDVLTSGGILGTVNAPFVNGLGQVGFSASATSPTDNVVFFNGGVIWRNSNSTSPVLGGAEATMGFSNSGDFCYSPSADGFDAAYVGSVGVVLKDSDADPVFSGFFNSFNSRPGMTADGRAYWIGGLSTTSSGSTLFRAFYWRATNGTITSVMNSGPGGTLVDGFEIAAAGIGFGYDVSDDGNFWVNELNLSGTGSTANDGRITKNNAVLIREGDPTGQGDNWQSNRIPGVNNLGTVVWGGDTDGSTSADDYIAVNGQIQLRESMTIDGVALTGLSTPVAVVNNNDLVASLWGSTSTNRVILLGNAEHMDASKKLIASGDMIDLDGDWVADATLDALVGSTSVSPVHQINDAGTVYIKASWTPIGGTQLTGIIGIPLPTLGDIDRDGEVGPSDFAALSGSFGSDPSASNWNAWADIDWDGEVGPNDFSILSANFGN